MTGTGSDTSARYTRAFEHLSKDDVGIAGGKGASLGEMTQAGIPVPPGYVVLTDAFEQFLDETDLRQVIRAELAKVDQDAVHTAERASEQIQNLIKKEDVPDDIKATILDAFATLDAKYVAVRSSATSEDSAENAWAGQLDSFLNTTKNTLLENVKNCWASLFTPRAIFYRIEKGLKESHVSVAVVVQKMVESESSGIAFSVHPVTEDPNQLIIEAGFGLGEAIVSGSITPDSYVVEKEPRKIIDTNVAEQTRGIFRKSDDGENEWRDIPAEEGGKQVLTDTQILELAEDILRIEQHYGFPCDIEWALEGGEVYIVQSRPITTLRSDPAASDSIQPTTLSNPDEWTNGQTPAYPLLVEYNGRTWVKDAVERYGDIVPLKRYACLIKESGTIVDFAFHKQDYVDSATALWNDRQQLENAFADFDKDEKQFQHIVDRLENGRIDIEESFEEFLQKYSDVYSSGILFDGFLLYSEQLVAKVIENLTPEQQEIADTLIHMPGLSFAQAEELDLLRIADGDESDRESKLQSHQQKYHWVLNNYKKVERLTIEHFENRLEELTAEGNIAEKVQSLETYEKAQGRFVKEQLEKGDLPEDVIEDLVLVGKISYYVDRRKAANLLGNHWLAQYVLKIANKTGVPYEDLMMLTIAEFESVIETGSLDTNINVESRKERVGVLNTSDAGQTLYEGDAYKQLEQFFAEINKVDDDVHAISGTSAYKGVVTGRVKVFLHADEKELKDGEILVTSMTRPDFVPLMKKAAAIVTNEGGITCHAAIVSRELKKPCVIGTKVATQVLKDGDLVEVDANTGEVRVLTSKSNASQIDALQSGDWQLDWDSHWSHAGIVLGCGAYFAPMQEQFGVQFRTLYMSFTNGHVRAYHETEELEAFGASLLEHIDTPDKAHKWANTFKEVADRSTKRLAALKPEVATETLVELADIYNEYGVWQVATKAVFSVLPADYDKQIRIALEDARKYSEKFYKERGVLEAMNTEIASKNAGYNADMISALTLDELRTYIQTNTLPDTSILQTRFARSAMLLSENGGVELFESSQAEQIEQAWHDAHVTQDGVRGTTGYKGVAQGRCRVLNDFHGVELAEDEVLVTVMTDPNYVPLIKQAAALVTDGGGMLCHAAIVARELKKPCVIGTKVATQVLKDGDLVEVDAEKGVVRILGNDVAFADLVGTKENYIKAVTRPYPPLLLSVIYEGIMRHESSQLYYADIAANTSQCSIGPDIYYLADDVHRLTDELFAYYCEKDKFEQVLPEFVKAEEWLFAAAEGTDYELYVQRFGEYTPALNVIYIQDNLFAHLHALLKESSDEDTADRLMDTLNMPLRLNYYRQEEYDLVTTTDVEGHIEKYKWLSAKYGSLDEYTLKQAKEKKDAIDEKQYLKEFAANKASVEKAVAEAKKLLGKKYAHLIDLMQWLVWFRTQRTDVIARATYLFHGGYEAKAQELGVTYDDLLWMTTKETLDGTVPTQAEIEARRAGYALYMDRKQQHIFSGDAYREAEEFMSDHIDDVTEIPGTVACAGNVTGSVKILHGKDDMAKVQKGDIVVATMTTPNMVPAMEKAAGFVTDEGGITCHAAIISREMNKPCIIGTKIATKALNDGDTIQLDADKGVVRILSSTASDTLRDPKSSVFTFESEGTTFLFEDVVVNHYMHWESSTQWQDNRVQVYVPETTVARLHRDGAALTKKQIQDAVAFLRSSDDVVTSLLAKWQKKEQLSTSDVQEAFTLLANICSEYALFDIHYSDGIFHDTGSKEDPRLKLYQKEKNELRDILNKPFFDDDGLLTTLVRRVAKQSDVPEADVHWYREQEVLQLTDGSKLSQAELSARQTAYVFEIDETFTRTLYTGAQAAAMLAPFRATASDADTLQGTTAHGAGTITGRVAIIARNYADPSIAQLCIDNMSKGDILVSQTTDPSLMKAFEKAGAVVTDVGGMLSHAAITSRELNVPCVVDTKIATQVLKDGDLVEVDAERGIVTILERSEDGDRVQVDTQAGTVTKL